jgi:hypothetical protein
LTITSAARNGIATANARMEIVAEASSDGAVRNGSTMYTPMRIRPP